MRCPKGKWRNGFAEKYTRLLSEAFLLFTLNRFTFKARERATANKKAYVVDPALAVCLGTRPGQDLGRLAENVVALALWRRQWAGEIEVAFWKNSAHEEVDFVVRERRRVARLIQVCWDLSDPRARAREFQALGKAATDLRCNDLWCLTRGAGGDEDFTWPRLHRPGPVGSGEARALPAQNRLASGPGGGHPCRHCEP